MIWAAVSVARARQWAANAVAFLTGKKQKNTLSQDPEAVQKPSSEWVKEYRGDSLWKSVLDYDTQCVQKDPVPGADFEHQEAYCQARDYQYAHRSRRFLLRQGYQSRLRRSYELFRAYGEVNGAATAHAAAEQSVELLATLSQKEITSL